MKKSRTHYAVLNSTVSSVIFIVNTIVKFIGRSVFIYYLGKDYLGVNGLFTSIISVLSLSELGIGGAIVYSLYKPLVDEDKVKIKSLIVLYKKIYRIIGLIVATIGLLLLPFIPQITNYSTIPNLTLIYLLFLFNSVMSYFFAYNASLLSADQKGYVITINNFLFSLLAFVFQVIFLIVTKSFIIYLLISIACTLLGNIVLMLKVRKEYHHLDEVQPTHLDIETVNELKKNTAGNLMDRIGDTVVNTTDNIYISMFVGLGVVGIYNNYILVASAIQGFIGQISSSITGSLGNMAASNNGDREIDIFLKHNFINYSFIYFCCIGLLSLLQDFTKLWVGEAFLLPMMTLVLIVIKLALSMYRNTALTFISAYGLSWNTRWKVIIECILNAGLSALFLIPFHLGLNGVLLGTIFSTILVVEWWEPYAVFKYGFRTSMMSLLKYFKLMFFHALMLVFSCIFILSIVKHIIVTGWIMLFVKGFCVLGLSFICFVLIFGRSNEFKYMLGIVQRILRRH